jgi:Family of unknown function (DUF6064)
MHVRRGVAEGAAVAAAAVAAAVTYGIYAVHPWQGSTPLNQFLAAFGRADTTAWPMQIVWYLAAVAMVGLALWPARWWSSPLICGLAAAYFAWIGIGCFAWLSPGIGLSGVWATVFTLQAVLLVVAGIARRDLVIRPRWDLSSALGGVFIAYALIGYPLVGVLGGHALRAAPLFGVSPCATVTFFFGLLLWAVPPAPKYLLLVPLAWALNAAPHNVATGVVVDYGMLAAALITTGLIIWRDRASGPAWHTVTAGLLFALLVAWSGHDTVLIGLAVLLLAVMLVGAITGHSRPPRAGPVPPPRPGKLKVS